MGQGYYPKTSNIVLIVVISANKKYLSFLHAICNIIGYVIGERAFYNADHLMALREGSSDVQKSGMTPTRLNSRV